MTTTSSATASGTTTSSTSSSRAQLSSNFETFIKMLTTQLQNQDPMQPMDTNQFTQQLVMYSQVEQQLSTNDKLDSLIGLQKTKGVQSALGYMGWEVSADTKDLALQNKQGIFNITLSKEASSVTIGIADSTGKTVRGLSLTGSEFAHDGKLTQDIVWDGKDSNGNQLEDGVYTISVTAKDASGATVKSTIRSYGTVTGVDVDSSGNTILKIGDLKISPDSVTSIRTPSSIDADGSS
jgi:flagellar basal-body rod modification protein FlgD